MKYFIKNKKKLKFNGLIEEKKLYWIMEALYRFNKDDKKERNK
jgi:hypothetical protein